MTIPEKYAHLITPHAERIRYIGLRNEIAVVIHEPSENTKKLAKILGWDGKAPVFSINRTRAGKLAQYDRDLDVASWLSVRAPRTRVLLASGNVVDALSIQLGPSEN